MKEKKYPFPWEVNEGKSEGYWQAIRRDPEQNQYEREQATRYGPYWADGTRFLTGERGLDYFPAWPSRIGASAPRRWPAFQPEETPPYVLRFYHEIASLALTDEPRVSDDPCSLQRLRDLKAHILERRRHSGSLFQDTAWIDGQIRHQREPLRSKLARGIRYAELEGIELYRRHDRIRWAFDAAANDESASDGGYRRLETHTDYKVLDTESTLVERILEKRANRGDAEAKEMLAQMRANPNRMPLLRSLLRERQKVGRKPIGDRAMTTAERVAKHRKAKALPPQERTEPGAVVPSLSLGPAVPGALIAYQEIEKMIEHLSNAPRDTTNTSARFWAA